MLRQRIWDFWAKRYENLWVQKYSLGPTRRELIKFLSANLKRDKEYAILDIGCGTGQLLNEIKARFNGYHINLTGIDFSAKMIEEAKGKDASIQYKVVDVKDLSTLNASFDIVICTHSFPYYDNQKKALADMRGLLKEAGYLLLAQASQNSVYDSIAMFFVKFTTGKAKYPGVKSILAMSAGGFLCEKPVRIKERFYMPSIYFFALRRV